MTKWRHVVQFKPFDALYYDLGIDSDVFEKISEGS